MRISDGGAISMYIFRKGVGGEPDQKKMLPKLVTKCTFCLCI
jgi:hypothetical protein